MLGDFQEEPPEAAPASHHLMSTTVALSICMMAHSYLLISVFPYSGYMTANLLPSLDEDSVGSYAGILAALMIGRATTAYGWGKMADVYGRTTVLYISLALASVLSLLFGLSPTFGWAVFLRFCLGLSNGILGTLRTTVSEIAQGDEQVETRIMTIVMGMWSWGFLVSPAVSGALAEPTRQYARLPMFQKEPHSWTFTVLSRFPFLLPNLLGSLVCIAALGFVVVLVRETAHQRRDPRLIPDDVARTLRSCCGTRQQAYKRLDSDSIDPPQADDKAFPEDDDLDGVTVKTCADDNSNNNEATIVSILARQETRTYLFVYWIASFVSVAFNEVFPLFCMSRVAGLGLEERQIGQIMSLGGLIFAVGQYSAQSVVYSWFGLLGSVRAAAILGTPTVFLVPVSILFNRGTEDGQVSTVTTIFLALVLAINRLCVMVFYSNVSVAMNRSVPPNQRATTQGVCGVGENLAKGLGPLFAGALTSFAVSRLGKDGSTLMFATVGLVGAACALFTCCWLEDASAEQDTVEEVSEDLELC